MKSKKDKKNERLTITKADLVEKVFEKIGFSKKEASEYVETVFEILKDLICEEGKVKISGFGNFTVKEKKERKGRNPQTGERMSISARRVLSFKSSSILRSEINAKKSKKIKRN